jgi:hypothetical protein
LVGEADSDFMKSKLISSLRYGFFAGLTSSFSVSSITGLLDVLVTSPNVDGLFFSGLLGVVELAFFAALFGGDSSSESESNRPNAFPV